MVDVQKVVDELENILKKSNLSALTAYAKNNYSNSTIKIVNYDPVYSGIEFIDSHPGDWLRGFVEKKEINRYTMDKLFRQLFKDMNLEAIIQKDPAKEMKIFIDDGDRIGLKNVYFVFKK
ncbi:hypothetical protein RY280_23535 [Bacillus paralicheniformis]|uniref:hypothetical protein n=1 Tax=Bacillus paralicheniformis TaxID=1648923 RepID=UPI00203CBB1F|nr:hypothetical protein [Bacillus paralicheniformis]MCM3425587.1 hypothetical protein [Bacillus paralicheniformis]